MKKVYYAVYDRKSETYSAPFLEVKDGTAIRAVQDLVMSNPDHPFAKHPGDFSLHRLGVFEDESGTIEGLPKPEKLSEIENLTGE
jgi:hypothetical protein